MKRGKKRSKRNHLIALVGALLVFALYLVTESFTGLPIFETDQFSGGLGGGFSGGFSPYGYGGDFGFLNILDLYNQFPSWIDFGLFLAIFLGLGMSVFGEHFDTQVGKAVYTGLAIFLALALLIFEQRTGIHLITFFSSVGFAIIVLLISVFIFKWIHQASGSSILGTTVGYVFFFIFASPLLGCGSGASGFQFSSASSFITFDALSFIYSYVPFFCPLMYALFLFSIFVGAWGVVKLAFP